MYDSNWFFISYLSQKATNFVEMTDQTSMSAADLLNIPWTYQKPWTTYKTKQKQNIPRTHQSVDGEVAAVNCFAKCNRPSICSKHINLIVPPLARNSLIVFTGGRYLVLHTCQGSIWQDVDIIFERPGREVEPGDFSNKGEINQGQTHHNDVRACFTCFTTH